MEEPIDIEALQSLVRQHRKRFNLSLRAAAEESGVPFTTLSRIERGHLPDLANFRRLVAWLGLEPERFFSPPRTRKEPTVDAIARHLSVDPNLTPRAAERIAEMVRELYDNFAKPAPSAKVHLRAAPTFTPAAATALSSLLADIEATLVHKEQDRGTS